MRGAKFWLFAALCTVLALPLLGYAIAWGYVNFGFLNKRIEAQLSRKFGTPAHVGALKSDVLQSASLNAISIEARDMGAPMTISSASAEWDFRALLFENRLRSIVVNGPSADFRYKPKVGWNYRLNLTPDETPMQIGRIEVKNGSLAFSMPDGNAIKLQNISGNFTDLEGRGPSPFALRGDLNSLEPLVIEGSAGPGSEDFSARVYGRLLLERDVQMFASGIPGLKGGVRFEISARRAHIPTGTSGREPYSLGATLNLNGVSCPLPTMPGSMFNLADDAIDIQAGARDPEKSPLIEFRGLRVASSRLGNFSANGSLQRGPGGSLRLVDAGGTFDLDAIDAAFTPRLTRGMASVRGHADLSDASLTLPLSEGAPPLALEGILTSRRLLLNVQGLGDLPPADVELRLAWPALKSGIVKLADIGMVDLQIDDLNRVSGPATAAEVLRLNKFHFDLGQFGESAVGRRLFSGSPAGASAPLAKDLPYAFSGILNGSAVQAKWSAPFSATASTALSIAGLSIEGLAVTKWPFAFRAPAVKFSGLLQPNLEFSKGTLSSVTLSADLRTPDYTPPDEIAIAIQTRWTLGANGQNSTTYEIKKLSVPLAAFDRILGLLSGTGIELSGRLTGDNVMLDPQATSYLGHFKVSNGGASFPIPEGLRNAAADALRSMNQGIAAALVQSSSLIERASLREMEADFVARIEGRKYKLNGTIRPAKLFVKIPLIGEVNAEEFPGLTFQIETHVMADGSLEHQGVASIDGGTLSCDATQLADGKWRFKGALKTKSGLNLSFDGAYDDRTDVAGPIRISIPRLELSSFSAKNSPAKLPTPDSDFAESELSGAVKDIGIEILPFAAGAAISAVEARITGQFANAAFSAAGQSFEQLRGPFTARAIAGKEQISVDAQATLDSYEALLGRGSILLPPPSPGKSAALKCAFSAPLKSSGIAIRMEKCEFDLPDILKCSFNGSLQPGPGGVGSATELNNVLLLAPDLAALTNTLGPINLKNREPWFGDLKLHGRAYFTGAAHWDSEGHYGIDGKLTLDGCALSAGAVTPFKIDGVNGSIPLALRRDGGPPRDGGPRATVEFNSASYAHLTAQKQSLEVECLSNGFRVHTTTNFNMPGLAASLGPIHVANLAPPLNDPRILFRLNLRADVAELLRGSGINLLGLDNCVLEGPPIECAIARSPGLRGPWELFTGATTEYKGDGMLIGPFLDGKLMMQKFNARGLFGPAPVMGCSIFAVGKNWPERNQGGVSVQEFLKQYPKYGQFNVRVRAALQDLETVSLDLHGIQNFTFDVDAAGHHKNDFFYDGVFATALNHSAVRAAFPAMFSDEYIRQLTFGVKDIAFQYQLENGVVKGPRAKLPGNLIIEGYGAESNPFATRYKKDVSGDFEFHITWENFLNLARETLKP